MMNLTSLFAGSVQKHLLDKIRPVVFALHVSVELRDSVQMRKIAFRLLFHVNEGHRSLSLAHQLDISDLHAVVVVGTQVSLLAIHVSETGLAVRGARELGD